MALGYFRDERMTKNAHEFEKKDNTQKPPDFALKAQTGFYFIKWSNHPQTINNRLKSVRTLI